MLFGSSLPVWFLLLILFTPVLIGFGIKQFLSKKFSKIAITLSAVIYVSFLILKLLTSSYSNEAIVNSLGMPFSLAGLFLSDSPDSLLFFGLIGVALNYFAFFGVINFLHRKFIKKLS